MIFQNKNISPSKRKNSTSAKLSLPSTTQTPVPKKNKSSTLNEPEIAACPCFSGLSHTVHNWLPVYPKLIISARAKICVKLLFFLSFLLSLHLSPARKTFRVRVVITGTLLVRRDAGWRFVIIIFHCVSVDERWSCGCCENGVFDTVFLAFF